MSSTSVCLVNECNDYSVLNEIKVIDAQKDTYKIRGSSLLQTINEVNSNRRIYSMAIGERFVETANEKIDKNRMLGEMDHPTITNIKDPAQLKRQMVVLYEKVCQKFTKMWIEGTNILGLVETTSNQHGIDMARMANIDGIPIGFSCRALGKVKPSNRGKNIVEVTEPAIFVTYDGATRF